MAAAQLAEAVVGNRDAIVGGVGRRLRASRVTIERVKTAGRAVERIQERALEELDDTLDAFMISTE